MFLLANVTGILGTFAASENLKVSTNNVWFTVDVISLAINRGFLNIADWEFSFEYYNMVRIIPFVLDEIPPP
jgi:drug/metabolite transporter superfamily protein YnfA